MALCQWEFKHLEVVGTKYSCPPDWAEIRGRIPQLKVETRRRIDNRKESQTTQPKTQASRFSAKRQSVVHVKPPKEKVITVKVVLPKKKIEVPERNYLCTCEEKQTALSVKHRDGAGDVEEIGFNELMMVFLKYNEGPRKESSKALRNIVMGFQGSKILTNDEAIQVCPDSDRSRAELIRSLRSFSDTCLITCQLDLIIVPLHNSVGFNALKLDKYFHKPRFTYSGPVKDSTDP